MSEWKVYKLEDIVSFSQGFQISTDQQYEVKEKDMDRFIRIVDYTNKNEKPRYIKKIDKRYWAYKDDVVMIRYGSNTAGKVVRGLSGYIANNMFKVNIIDNNILDKEFLYYFLSQERIYKYLMSSQSSSTMPAIKFSDLYKIDAYLPTIEQQRKVATFLNCINDKIQLNTQTNQTLEAIAQAIFKSWFVDFDPVRAKAQAILDGKTNDEANLSAMAVISGKAVEDLSQTEYQELWEIADAFPSELVENAEFGEVPKGWEVRKVGEIANFIKGKKPKQTSNFQENEMLPHILVASLSGKYGEFAPIETAVICQNKETLILMDGSGSGKVSIGHNGVVGSTLAKLNLNNEKYWAIIYLLLKSKELDIQQHTTGTSIPHTDKTRVLNYDLIIPCDVILNWFNGYFENTLYLILTNRNKSLFLEKARDELLPKLLSGEIDCVQF